MLLKIVYIGRHDSSSQGTRASSMKDPFLLVLMFLMMTKGNRTDVLSSTTR